MHAMIAKRDGEDRPQVSFLLLIRHFESSPAFSVRVGRRLHQYRVALIDKRLESLQLVEDEF